MSHAGLAAAIANMKHDEDMQMAVSPSIMLDPTQQFYARLFSQNLLNPQLMAANTALMARFPLHMHQLAAAAASASTTRFYNHQNQSHQQYPTNLFSSWTNNDARTSPPISPVSPATLPPHLSSTNHYNNNNLVSTTTTHLPTSAKKPRKSKPSNSHKNDLMTPPPPSTPFDLNLSHDMNSPTTGGGPISPPTSGASPQSTGSIDMSSNLLGKDGSSRDKQFTCKICYRSFGYKHVLQNHERTHTGEKPFECPECHKRFTRDHHLKTHMRLHTGEKPYHCDHCDRHFVQVANLRRHMRVHTGEKPYKCEICKSTFADSNQLKGHKAVHNDEKPYHCDRCNEMFKRRHHKCSAVSSASGLTSPPTPIMSPARSPAMSVSSDLKGTNSDISDLSLDLSRSTQHNQQQTLNQHHFGSGLQSPTLDHLYNAATATASPSPLPMASHIESRRIVRHAPVVLTSPTAMPSSEPEQTEPEDLSMHSPRSNMSSVDEDLDDLDDAATLFAKQKERNRKTKSMSSKSSSSRRVSGDQPMRGLSY